MLADMYVQLSVKGGDTVNKEIGATGEYLKKAAKAADDYEKRMKAVGNAILGAGAVLGAFVTKGLQGTVEGERMGAAFQVLAETIASAFLPVVELLTDGIIKLSSWLDKLSNEGVAAIMAFGAAFALAMAYATG